MARRNFEDLPRDIKDAVAEDVLGFIGDDAHSSEFEFFLDAHRETYESGLVDFVVGPEGELRFREGPTAKTLREEGLLHSYFEMRGHMLELMHRGDHPEAD